LIISIWDFVQGGKLPAANAQGGKSPAAK